MKNVNQSRGMYFLLAIFGMTLFFGMFSIAPTAVFAPEESSPGATQDFSTFGKPSSFVADDARDETSSVATPSPLSTRLFFTGDIMLARAVEWSMKESGAAYPFALWDASTFSHADAVIGNFEGTIRDTEHLEQTNVMAFDTLPAYTIPLGEAGFTHLSLANNHADDFGQEVTDFTRATLTSEGFTVFGDPFVGEDFIAHIAGDIPVALIGFHAFNEESSGIVDAIAAEKAAGNFVVVYPHWGTEYEHDASAYQTAAADAWIAAGADMIIGAHPHVVQGVEVRGGIPVVYSLGNFLFDQDFSLATKIGAIADVAISSSEIVVTFSPVRITGRQVFVDHGADAQLASWLGIPSLTWTIPREAAQTP